MNEINQALKEAGLTHLQAVRLALELVEMSGARRMRGDGRLNRCRRIMRLGAEQQKNGEHTVSFAHAVETLLHARRHRRPRTVAELRGVFGRLLRECPDLRRRRLSSLSTEDCRRLLEQIFPTPRQRTKARALLHALFALGERRCWCRSNPLNALELPPLSEREIIPLSPEQLHQLLRAARRPEHRPCMAALGLMLWAGVRPTEVTRLRSEDIDFEEQVVVLRPQHSKTGGCRHVPIRPVLTAWLRESPLRPGRLICPKNWRRRWPALRRAAGIVPWPQDVLRHTFASYHAKHFRNFAALQEEMGHRSASLLRTRYLSMRGVTAEAAALFWKPNGL